MRVDGFAEGKKVLRSHACDTDMAESAKNGAEKERSPVETSDRTPLFCGRIDGLERDANRGAAVHTENRRLVELVFVGVADLFQQRTALRGEFQRVDDDQDVAALLKHFGAFAIAPLT